MTIKNADMPVVPKGWQLVPVYPTIKMVQAATHSSVGFGTRAAYQAMLAAAPKLGGEMRDLGETLVTQHKQDNSWHERGEFPPAGCECYIRHSCWNSEKYEKVTVAAITNEYVIVKYATFEQHYMLKDISFRPIRTERDVLIEMLADFDGSPASAGAVADAILAAGFSMGAK